MSLYEDVHTESTHTENKYSTDDDVEVEFDTLEEKRDENELESVSVEHASIFILFYKYLLMASEIDQFLILFILGMFSSGLFYQESMFLLHLACTSFTIALSICFDKYNADKDTVAFALFCIYLWFVIAIFCNLYPASTIGACELGYSIQRSFSRQVVDAESAAMISFSLNSIFVYSYFNTIIILLYAFYRARYIWSLLCTQSYIIHPLTTRVFSTKS